MKKSFKNSSLLNCIIVFFVYRVKNSGALHRTFNVDPLYLKHENSGTSAKMKINPFSTNGFSHYYHLGESTFILRDFSSGVLRNINFILRSIITRRVM